MMAIRVRFSSRKFLRFIAPRNKFPVHLSCVNMLWHQQVGEDAPLVVWLPSDSLTTNIFFMRASLLPGLVVVRHGYRYLVAARPLHRRAASPIRRLRSGSLINALIVPASLS